MPEQASLSICLCGAAELVQKSCATTGNHAGDRIDGNQEELR